MRKSGYSKVIIILFVILILITFTILTYITGFISLNFFRSDDSLINSRIDLFLKNYNDGDLNGVLDCLDKKTKNTYKSAMNLSGTIMNKIGLKIDLSDLFGISVGFTSDGDLLRAEDREIDYKSDKEAEMSVMLVYDDKYMPTETHGVILELVKEGNDWFIHNIKSNN